MVCQLIAQGSFYWVSSAVAAPTVSGWWNNYVQYLFPYMQTTAMYVAAAALVHVAATSFARTGATAPR